MLSVTLVIMALGCFPTLEPRLPSGKPRFTDLRDGTVRDEQSGLVWSRDANLPGFAEPWDGMGWEAAFAFVSDMNAGTRPNMGQNDWRIPTDRELRHFLAAFWRPSGLRDLSFLDLGPTRRRTTQGPFVNIPESAFWSSTSERSDSQQRVVVVDTGLATFVLPATGSARLWPVRGVARP